MEYGGVQDDVHGPHGLTKVYDNKHQTHGYGRNGQEFAQDGNLTEHLVVMEVIRQDQHYPSGRDTDQKGKLGDIKPPGYIPAHAGNTQAGPEL